MITDRPLKIEDNIVVINPEYLEVKEFKTIWNKDKSKDKLEANKLFSALYFISDFRSPYYGYSNIDKIKQVAEDIMEDKSWRPDKDFLTAMEKYTMLQTTPTLRLLNGAMVGINSLTEYFQDQKYKNAGGRRNKDFNVDDVLNPLSKLTPIVENIKKLEREIKKEIEEEITIRGGGTQGVFEDPE